MIDQNQDPNWNINSFIGVIYQNRHDKDSCITKSPLHHGFPLTKAGNLERTAKVSGCSFGLQSVLSGRPVGLSHFCACQWTWLSSRQFSWSEIVFQKSLLLIYAWVESGLVNLISFRDFLKLFLTFISQIYIVSDLISNAFSISLFCMMLVMGLSCIAFIMLKYN